MQTPADSHKPESAPLGLIARIRSRLGIFTGPTAVK